MATDDFFRARLDGMVDPRHPLVVLANRRAVISAPGPAVQRLMGEYYPVAAWCDKSTFERGGWQACLGRP